MDLRRHLSDPSLLVEHARVGDRWPDGERRILVDDPSTGVAIGSVPDSAARKPMMPSPRPSWPSPPGG